MSAESGAEHLMEEETRHPAAENAIAEVVTNVQGFTTLSRRYAIARQALDALRSLPVEERARAVGLTVHQCRQCGGVGYVADHDTACFGNCERHGCPVQLPCTNCQGLGVELQPDVPPPLAAIEEPF